MSKKYQPKHLKQTKTTRVPLAGSDLRSSIAVAAVTAALLPSLLATPALAATQIGIDGNTYTKATEGKGSEGGTWSWGGKDEDPLNLNSYKGGAISWQGGDLTINANGDNTVSRNISSRDSGSSTSQGDTTGSTTSDQNSGDTTSNLTITGGGTVNVDYDVYTSGDVTVEGGSTLNYSGTRTQTQGAGFTAGKTFTVKDGSTISGGSAGVTVEGNNIKVENGSNLEGVDLSAWNTLTVNDSSVDAGGFSGKTISIKHSDVKFFDDSYGGVTLTDAEVKSGVVQPGSKRIISDARAHWNEKQEWDDTLSNSVVIAPTKDAAEQAVASTATSEHGTLAVRATPVAASNAPKDTSGAAATKTFIVSAVPTGDSETATTDTGKVQLAFSMGSDLAGHKATVYVEHEDGTFDVLESAVDDSGLVKVTTSKLSRYTVVVSKELASSGQEGGSASGQGGTTSNGTTTGEESKQATAASTAKITKAASDTTVATARHASDGKATPQTSDPTGLASAAMMALVGSLSLGGSRRKRYQPKHLRTQPKHLRR